MKIIKYFGFQNHEIDFMICIACRCDISFEVNFLPLPFQARQNKIAVLPEGFQTLAGTLRYLHLGRNYLKSLPDYLGSFHLLAELYVNKNLLTSLPPSFGNLRNLRTLYANHNLISELPDSFVNLQVISHFLHHI